jgi:glutamate-ammonia-ligase adenylyltransferase
MTEVPLPDPPFNSARRKAARLVLDRFTDPAQVAVRVRRLFHSEESIDWAEKALFQGDRPLPLLEDLFKTLAESEFLTSILEREPALLTSFESSEDFSFSSGPAVFDKELIRHLKGLGEDEDYRLALSRFRLNEIFRIALRDITEKASIEILARELSDLADEILKAAYEKAFAEKILTLGAPIQDDGSCAEMAILSLGKHGSRELNFSSDLDLIFLCEGEGKTRLEGRDKALQDWIADHPCAGYGPLPPMSARTRPVDLENFFTELGVRIIELLSDPGPLGAVYRIDMRLRPDGDSGPLVRSLESAVSYYHNWGERWERQALQRARVCAGSHRIGDIFLSEIEDFLHRKYVDPIEVEETLRQMRTLRFRAIAQAGASPEDRGRNVKNGPGGIRDVEFLVQAVQILYSGQYPELRVGNLFELIRRIRQSGLMNADDFETLSEGYNFLRRLEHRIQMDDLQRYHLPIDPGAKDRLAKGFQLSSGAALEERLSVTMRRVHAIFRVVFRVDEEEVSIADMLDRDNLSDWGRKALAQAGLSDPDAVFKSLKRLAADPEAPHLNSKLRRLLKSILPRLLQIVGSAPSPDSGWLTFERFCLSTPARSTFLSVAQENPQLLELLIQLGSASSHLAEFIQSSPNLIDDLTNRRMFERSFRADNLEEAFRWQEGSSEAESILPRLRAFRTRAEVHVAGRFALGLTQIEEGTRELSALAQFCLEKCINEVWRVGSIGMALFGLGKMGGRELGFRSDMDLIVLFDPKLQASSEIPHRLTLKLQREMNLRTHEGRLFEIDLNLRPHGKNSPPVTDVESALEYYRSVGQTWERLMLTRCRPLWGQGVVAKQILARLHEWVFENSADEGVLEEIHAMRKRIEKEKSKQILKAGPGGLLDVEFIAQAGQLRWGVEDPELRTPNTCEAISRYAERGLIDPKESIALLEAYRFLRDTENRLSLLEKPGAAGIPKDEETVNRLVGCLNLAARCAPESEEAAEWSPERLIQEDRGHRRRVREIFEALFQNYFGLAS